MAIKRINEMTDEEILALSDDQIEQLIDYECALAGVPFLPPAPVKPMSANYLPDKTAYKVGGFVFSDPEDAAKVLEAIRGLQTMKVDHWGSEYKYKKLIPVKNDDYYAPKIEQESYWSEEQWNRFKDAIETQTELEKSHKALAAEYDELKKRRDKYENEVWDIISLARRRRDERNTLLYHFDRYLKLSNGDRSIALNFLCNAYTVPEDLKEELSAQQNAA